MERLAYITALILLCVQWGESNTPIPNGREHVFSYTGVVRARNSATDVFASQWSIAAKLAMQSDGNNIVMKFKDIDTSLYNGELAHLKSANIKPLPEDAHQLYLPFVVHYRNNGSASSISHQPEDPLWSVNMKRAIASILQIDLQQTINGDGQKFYEDSIYGSCEAEYFIVETDSTKAVMKTIYGDLCTDQLESSWSSVVRAPTMPKDFNPASTVAQRTYTFLDADHGRILKHIESRSNITYRTMQNERSSQQLVQIQNFHLLNDSAITEPIDVSTNTESTSLQYMFDESDETSGRQEQKPTDAAKVLQDFKNYYEEFKLDFHKYPLVPGDMGVNEKLMHIFQTLCEVNDTDIKAFGDLFSEDTDMEKIFIFVLPYIGSKDSMKIMKHIFQGANRIYLPVIRMMATFPKYIDEYTPELLESMADMMTLLVTNKHVRHAGIFSFATLVAESHTRGEIPRKQLEKYYTKYNNLFRNATSYEDKMIYLLGLINMGTVLDADIMISIIQSPVETHHIRALAAYGFKPFLSSNPDKMFEILWPHVQNQKEHLEVRVAVLDLLMYSNLTQIQFDTIIEEFQQETDEPSQKNLQNYLASMRDALDRRTKYPDYLSAKAADSMDFMTVPSYHDAWGTGNYRFSYTDSAPNFGSYLQARLVSDPITNAINVIQLTYNQFAMSMNLGTYTAYIKLDGVLDEIFFNNYFKGRADGAIPQLTEILQKFNFEARNPRSDLHLELVLFCDNQVVFGMHLDKDSLRDFQNDLLLPELMDLLVDYESLSYPKMYTGNLRTDLGTHVKTRITDSNFVSHKVATDKKKFLDNSIDVKTGELNYRSSRYELVSLVSYNPLADVDITVYKVKSHALRVHLPTSFNITGQHFTFDNQKDAFNLVTDRTIVTSVADEKKLAEYCSSCEASTEWSMDKLDEKVYSVGDFGMKLNVTQFGDFEDSVKENCGFFNAKFFNSFRANSKALSLSEPVLLLLYTVDYYHYLGPEIGALSVRSSSSYEQPTEYTLEWEFDVDDAYNENDPINGTDLHAGMKISCRRKHDATILSSIGANYSYSDQPVSSEKSALSHVEQRHTLRAQYTDTKYRYLLCLDRDFKYPDRRADIYSISPVGPAQGKGRLTVGPTDESHACSNEFIITFSDVLESEGNLMKTVTEMVEYEKCKQDLVGLKYVPPTLACATLHEAVSKYNNYTLYVDLKQAGKLITLDKKLRTSDRGFKLLEYSYFLGDYVHVVVSKEFLLALPIYITPEVAAELLDFRTSLGILHGNDNPTTVAYDDFDLSVGISTSCGITVNNIRTFAGKDIVNYGLKNGQEIVAYVECIKASRGGLTVQKFADKRLGFTMWSGSDKLIVQFVDGRMHVVLNNTALDSHYTLDEHFKVYFLADDVIYVTNQMVEVYYNTEYVSVKVLSMYNNYICGLCTHQHTASPGSQVN